MSPYLLPALWVLNGFLAALYFLAEHWAALFTLPPLVWLVLTERRERRGRVATAAGLVWLAGAIAPVPVPYAVLLMAWAAAAGVKLEKHDPLALRWTAARALGLYGLMGLGFLVWCAIPLQAADPETAQGLIYVNALIGIAMYAYPLGFLALIAQAAWVHPPMARPDETIATIRTRGRED